jgi:hypothetical protein
MQETKQTGGIAMNKFHENNPASIQAAGSQNNNLSSRKKHWFLRTSLALIGILVLAVAAYSIYVAVHEPDPQETIILGQAKIASGSPAGLRILVRNRISGRPVRDANLVLSLSGRPAGPI